MICGAGVTSNKQKRNPPLEMMCGEFVLQGDRMLVPLVEEEL